MPRFCNTCGGPVEQRTRRGEPAEGFFTPHNCLTRVRLIAERYGLDLRSGSRVPVERYVPEQPKPRLRREDRRAGRVEGTDALPVSTVQRTRENGARLTRPELLPELESPALTDRKAA